MRLSIKKNKTTGESYVVAVHQMEDLSPLLRERLKRVQECQKFLDEAKDVLAEGFETTLGVKTTVR